ncbi:MAG TPA: SRPBCC domain-containing protein [Mesorhizobium sp.]|jgi:uncharacterized protein YndB with AHSA1/START domain
MSETPAVARELSLEFAIDEAPEKLWHALTEPRIVEQWLAPVVRNDPTTAGFSCELLATDPGRSVSYRWRDPDLGESIVTFGVSEREGGFSQLSVLQEIVPMPAVTMSGALGCSLAIAAPASRRVLTAANQARPALLRAA